MSFRDHALEWLGAVGVFLGTLAALHAIERQSPAGPIPPASVRPLAPAPGPMEPPVVLAMRGGFPVARASGL